MAGLWITPDDLGEELADSEYAVEAVETASYLLWAMSGRKYSGVVTVSERYAPVPHEINLFRYWERAASADTRLIAATLPELLRAPQNKIRLRGRPVVKINAVRSVDDGSVYDPDSYYIQDHSTVIFKSALVEEVEINYTYGQRPPAAGRMAARALAAEFAKMWIGEECDLPDRVTSVTRQGITFTILDNQDFIADLRTGVYAVDLFLKTTNPSGAQQRSKVFSPDIPRGKRVTPKPLVYPVSDTDFIVPAGGSASLNLELDEIGADYLNTSGWEAMAIVRNWTGRRTKTLDPDAISLSTNGIQITLNYSDALSILGSSDSGSWDLYAVNGPTTVYLTSGNVKIKLG